ncbi:MAG: histidine phosphatase family protein [Treponema sp.]|nr:histidine phosphatase family protein [Treponema sp.]
MRIILIRHGDPNYEEDCLTELGHKQAEVAAQRLLEEGIEEIYSSPQGRALQTAEAFSKASGIKDIKVLDFIREIRFGREGELYDNKWNPWNGTDKLIWEGKSLQTDKWREYPLFIENYATEDADKIGIEADKWLSTLGYEREGLYYRCTRKTDEQKTIAVFNHGGASSAFMARVLNQQFPYMCSLLHFAHTAISILRFDKTPGNLTLPIVELMNDSRHLKNVK